MIEDLANTKPMVAAYAQKAVFSGDDGKSFTVAVAPGDEMAKESLLRDRLRGSIEDLLLKIKGSRRKLRAETKEGIQPSAPPPEQAEAEEPPPEYPPDPALEPPAPERAPPEPGAKAGDPADIHNDPLVDDAVDIFEAEMKS